MPKLVSSLSRADLDYWTARAEGIQHIKIQEVPRTLEKICVIGHTIYERYDPSTNWSVLGSLLEKYNVFFEISNVKEKGAIFAFIGDGDGNYVVGEFGNNRLIAACRCIVASKFGDEVPEE